MNKRQFIRRWLLAGAMFVCTFAPAGLARAADWPQLGFDAAHAGHATEALPAELHPLWTLTLPALKPTWPDQSRVRSDSVYHPIVLGRRMILTSSADDSVAAYDLDTARLAWRFFTGGPIRVAPAGSGSRVFVGSDDGYLYALDVEAGTLVWKFKGAPRSRGALGNGRMVDTWAVRGGPVVADGNVYFAAGIWPFMGIFVHCLDADTGRVVWTNSGEGSDFIVQPHGYPSFGGISPQGTLAVAGDKLLVPNGRAVPAVLDRATGKLLAFEMANKFGGDAVVTAGRYFFTGDEAFSLATGKPLAQTPANPIIIGNTAFAATADGIASYEIDALASPLKGRLGVLANVTPTLCTAVREGTALIAAGGRLYVGGKGFVAAIDEPADTTQDATTAWRHDIDGTVAELIAASGRLLVVSDEGKFTCLGEGPPMGPQPAAPPATSAPEHVSTPAVLGELRGEAGYGLALGAASESITRQIVANSALHMILLEADESKADALRRRLQADGLYGERIAVWVGDISTAALPPYFASVVVSDEPVAESRKTFNAVFGRLHPYRGRAYVRATESARRSAEAWAAEEQPGHAAVSLLDESAAAGGWIKLARHDGLTGAANWTHENADAANTRVSKDVLVKAPLGVLWFGGSSNEAMLPRHGHGPEPQVIDGRLLIEGVDCLRAMDIYTGRVLWEAPLPGLGSFYNVTVHQPGANGTGTNFVSTSDGIYVVRGRSCVRLNPATGRTLCDFELPASLSPDADAIWGYLNVDGDYLIGGVASAASASSTTLHPAPKHDPDEDATHHVARPWVSDARAVGSRALFVMDRHTGKVLWTVAAQKEFRHNAICTGGGRLYAIDPYTVSPPKPDDVELADDKTSLVDELALLASAGARLSPANAKGPTGTLYAFDLATGQPVWTSTRGVFGTWLSYSTEHDMLVESGRRTRDALRDEARGIRAYRAADGEALWCDPLANGPAMIRHGTILKEGSAADLLTGAPVLASDPITGERSEWTWTRLYGCNTPIASEHLLTFRSGAAGFYDLARLGGTGNFGGFRSSCTNNLIVAGGVLTAPDYTRTCTCSYQMQTSLAMVSDPDAEEWTYQGSSAEITAPIKRIGINLGAPGNRVDDAGTLWLEYPVVGGKSPRLKVKAQGSGPGGQVEYLRRHSEAITGAMPWVTASGARGLRQLWVPLNGHDDTPKAYTVKLYFAQPPPIKAGECAFDVLLAGRRVEQSLDVTAAAGGNDRSLVREYRDVEAGEGLAIELRPTTPNAVPILCGVEIIADSATVAGRQ